MWLPSRYPTTATPAPIPSPVKTPSCHDTLSPVAENCVDESDWIIYITTTALYFGSITQVVPANLCQSLDLVMASCFRRHVVSVAELRL
mmetsp:Transcript_2900/g.3407  ORF Transcript_2900/g.3407 Transcript_2900/m.3407 type:complete len:89 (+) Transcript_2900:98-364(+)